MGSSIGLLIILILGSFLI
ncbi:hypothetical protein [Lutibacter sp.]